MTLIPCSQCGNPMEVKSDAAIIAKVMICDRCAKNIPLRPSHFDYAFGKSFEVGGIQVTPVNKKFIRLRTDKRGTKCSECIHAKVCALRSSVEPTWSRCPYFRSNDKGEK